MDDVTRDECVCVAESLAFTCSRTHHMCFVFYWCRVDAVQGTLEAASRSDVPILNHTWATKSVDAGSLLPQDEFMLVAPH